MVQTPLGLRPSLDGHKMCGHKMCGLTYLFSNLFLLD